jgi:hypothetical protein
LVKQAIFRNILVVLIALNLFFLSACSQKVDVPVPKSNPDLANISESIPNNTTVDNTENKNLSLTKPSENEQLSGICANSSSYENRLSCYVNLALQSNDGTKCDLAGSDRNWCYDGFAEKTQNMDACENIDDLNVKDGCYYSIMIKKYVSSNKPFSSYYCDKLTRQSYRDTCFYSTGTVHLNLSLCNKIVNQERKDDCYAYIGQKKQDSNICDQIITLSSRDSCYSLIAMPTNNCDLCERVVGTDSKETCLAYCKI